MTKATRKSHPRVRVNGSTAERARPGLLAVRLAFGLVLAASAVAKLAAPGGFVAIMGLYGIPLAAYTAAVAIALELAAGVLLLAGWYPGTALVGSGLLLLAYWSVTLFGPRLLTGCGCLGTAGPVLSFGQHVALLVAMTTAWGALLWARRPERSWLTERRGQAVAAAFLVVALLAGAQLSRREAAVPTEARAFRAIPVATLDGKMTVLDATRTPVFFFAYWCPHCTAVMKEMASEPLPVRPVLVSTFFRGKDQTENRERTLAKLREVGLRPEDGWTVYLDVTRVDPVKSVPSLAYMAGGEWHVESVPHVEKLRSALGAAQR